MSPIRPLNGMTRLLVLPSIELPSHAGAVACLLLERAEPHDEILMESDSDGVSCVQL